MKANCIYLMILWENMLKLSLWQIWCLQQDKSRLNQFLCIRILGVAFMNSKTHMVVMEVVSLHLDWYKNNGLISNLHEILSGQIWACCLVWFLINYGFFIWLWNWYVFTRHLEEWFCKIAWRLDVFR